MCFFDFFIDKTMNSIYYVSMKHLRNHKNSENLFYQYIDNDIFHDLYVSAVGKENCLPNKTQEGPFVKNRYIIHFVTEGKGFYNLNGKLYSVKKGDVFYIPTNYTIYYYPVSTDPWKYFWFEYNGQNALTMNQKAGFTENNPIYSVKNFDKIQSVFTDMMENLNGKADDYITISCIYRFFYEISVERSLSIQLHLNARDDLMKKIFHHIGSCFSDSSLSLSEIAEHFNLNASYLSRLFKKQSGIQLSKYIIEYRMQKALVLLERPDLSIKAIALSVGYNDPLYFSKEFARKFKKSPTSYRQELTNKRQYNK